MYRACHEFKLCIMVLVMLLGGAFLASDALANYSTGSLFSHSGWDYSASNFMDGTLHKYYWCGSGVVQGVVTDVIYYRYYDTSTGIWSSISRVLSPTSGSWEDGHGAGTCNPSVVKGTFSPGDGYTL
jgi:hypothetical protein